MNIFVISLSIILLATCLYFTYTDLRFNLIKNKYVFAISALGLLTSVLGYMFLAKALLSFYFVNVVIAVVLSGILYSVHIWAAGDSKMYICMALLMPVIFSMYGDRVLFASIYIAALAFVFGFIYLMIDTIRLILKREIVIEPASFFVQLRDFVFRYIRNIAIITGLWAIEGFLELRMDESYGIAIAAINLMLLIGISALKNWIKNTIAVIFLLAGVLINVLSEINTYKMINVKYYLIIVLFMIFRILINEGNYATISSAEVKKGMILSTVTTMMMANSRIKGLPRISKENMADRLTEEEAEAVRKWGKVKGQILNVQIVKKVPFAIFLTLGLIAEIIMWGILNFAN